jgi:hypothetical protein
MAVAVTVTVANGYYCIYYYFYLFSSSYSCENKWALRLGQQVQLPWLTAITVFIVVFTATGPP